MTLPLPFKGWFESKGWQIREHQLALLEAFRQRESALLVAPTGAGKTLAGFLPALIDLWDQDQQGSPFSGLHTLYLSPLKALTHDIERNLEQPVRDLGLPVQVETRTGDTPSHKRQRQKRKPPHMLLTTPESLMLMLSYVEAPGLFGKLRWIIVDEAHSLVNTKRGDFAALALARLRYLAPQARTVGLSATTAQPERLAAWLEDEGRPAQVIRAATGAAPVVQILRTGNQIPYSGFMARYAIAEIYGRLLAARSTLVFVNTRAQAEWLFQMLWEHNREGLAIAVYHGSLSREQRRMTESLVADGKVRAVVTTSALELGIDWGDVDQVIQVGAPKGVSRLLQRLGRSNHRLDEASQAWLVPTNRFEALECTVALEAIAERELDDSAEEPGAYDIIPQFIINCACSEAVTEAALFEQVRSAWPYRNLTWPRFQSLFAFARDGGYALSHYERFQRLEPQDHDRFRVTSRRVAQRHRQNIGTIVEAARLKVKRLSKGKRGKVVGEVEEGFAQQLTRGDTFLFAGEVLAFEGIRDLFLEARPVPYGEAKIPSYAGGQMPLSTFLAERVRGLLAKPARHRSLPVEVQEWLQLQQEVSLLPNPDHLLVEHFSWRDQAMTLIYTFEGRRVNQTLGFLLTRRMESLGLQPLSFSVTDYALSIAARCTTFERHLPSLLAPEDIAEDLEDWLEESPMLKRSFRRVAMVSGLTEKQIGGQRKTLKQVTFSTDLIYDVLREHEPDHVLLAATRQDAERELLDWQRLCDYLRNVQNRWSYRRLEKPSPLSVPVLVDVRVEAVRGAGMDAMLEALSREDEAESLMANLRAGVTEA